ncbi:hypothetical protein GCM10028809_35790 [Spirosoma gilvum]
MLRLVGTTAHAQCPSPTEVHTQLVEIGKKENTQKINLLTDLQKKLQQNNCLDSNYTNVLHYLGLAYYTSGQYEKATQKFKESIAINQQLKYDVNSTLQIDSYLYLGVIRQLLQDESGAINFYKTCVHLGKLYNKSHQTVGFALMYLSFLYQERGDYQNALNLAQQGVYQARLCANKTLEALCLGEEARDLKSIGKYEEALPVIENAIQLIQSIKGATNTRIFFTVIKAEIAANTGNAGLSITLYLNAIAYYQQNRQIEQAAHALGNLGYLYMDVYKDYGKAIVYLQRAYETFTSPYHKARVLNNIAVIYSREKQFDKALVTYQKALLTLPINFHQSNSRYNPSAAVMQLAVDKEYLLTLIQDKANTWLTYAKETKSLQRLQYALSTYQIADQMIDIMRWEHIGQQSKLFWRQKTRGMYERAIETCYRLGSTEQAFRFMEKSRAVMLADKLNELGAKRQLSPKQAAEEKRLHKRVSERQAEIATLTPDSTHYEPVRMALNACQDSLNSFLKELEQSNPAYYRYKYDNATPSLAELQRYLTKQGSSLVTYFVGDSALYLMAVSGGKSILKKQPIGPYTQALKQFAPLLATAEAMRKTSEVNRYLILSNSLYQQLLTPLNLPKGRVIVSPDGFFIPFDALSRSASQPQYLVADYAFSYVYSARLLLKNQAPDRQITGFRTYDFLGIAPVDFAPSLGQVMLPNSDAALTLIGKRFRSAKLLTHETATREAFLSKASTARIIHLFTHAVADSTDQEPKLYFADSTLKLSDLSDGALPNAKLIVLAACKTGIGANQRGEGVFSLARGFAALGVPSVLTTLWSVENEATYRLTDLFYTYLDQGLTKDIALQRAKQDWLKTAEGAGQLPNYWAGLIIVGDAEPMVTNFVGLWVILPILLLSSVGLWLWRKRKQQSQAYILAPKEV